MQVSIYYLRYLPLILFLTHVSLPSMLKGQVINWSYEEIVADRRESGAQPDLFVDGTGNFHVSFWQANQDKLQYAFRDQATGNWSVETVPDPALVGYLSAIFAEADGTVHIAYHGNRAGEIVIKHAQRAPSGSWTISTVADGDFLGFYGPDINFPTYLRPSIEIFESPSGNIEISYFNADYGLILFCNGVGLTYFNYELDLNAAVLENGQWTPYSFSDLSYQGLFPNCLNRGDRYGEFLKVLPLSDSSSLALTVAMHSHELLAFRSNANEDPGTWPQFSLDSVTRYLSNVNFYESFGYLDAKTDPTGRVHMTYNTSLNYGQRGISNSRQVLLYSQFHPDSLGQPGYQPYRFSFPGSNQPRFYSTLAVQDSANLSIFYYQRISGDIIEQRSVDGGQFWGTTDTIFKDVFTNTPMLSHILGDSLYLLVFDGQRDLLWSAARSLKDPLGSWQRQKITQSQAFAEEMHSRVSRANGDDRVQVAYNDGLSGGLFYAEKTGTSWNYETVFNDGQRVGQIQLLEQAASGPAIIYQDLSEVSLALAQRSGGNWQTENIPQPGLASDFSAVEQNGAIHLCYYDPSSQSLNYGLKDGSSSWQFEILDDQGSFVGLLPRLATDKQGGLHLAYFDRGNNELKYGYRPQGSNWTLATVNDTNALELTSISIATGPDNEPKIAFQDTDMDSMFLAERINGDWSISKLDIAQTDASGRPLRLQIDDKGRPWVLYNFPTTNNEIRLTRRNLAGQWLQVSVLNNQADIAGEFELHIVEDDFYILGRQNKPGDTGLGMLNSPNGVNTSVTESPLFDQLLISPNPTLGSLRVSWEQSRPAEVSLAIYNLQGQFLHPLGVTKITEPGKHQHEFDLSSLSPGVYLLRFAQNGQSWMKKVIKLAD